MLPVRPRWCFKFIWVQNQYFIPFLVIVHCFLSQTLNLYNRALSRLHCIRNTGNMAALIDDSLPIVERCYARIGLMGNPSDGFGGKTVSALIGNFYASCTIKSSTDASIHLTPHPIYDPTTYTSLQDLHDHTLVNGYYGGMRLLQATCRVFYDYLTRNDLHHRVLQTRRQAGFSMSYDTTIPRCVGLSGSSAIITAAFRCLLRFHGELTLEELGIPKDVFPSIILSIEKSELKISAGLQDRVIQTYGGLVHMDFTKSAQIARAPSDITMSTLTQLVKPGGCYTPLDPALLPDMYLAYNIAVGGDSGTVHSTVKERWEQQDPELVRCMLQLGAYADQSVAALQTGDHAGLGALMNANFAMRRHIYGDEVVGAKNIAVIEQVKLFGMAAKFTGSGGAILCLRLRLRAGGGAGTGTGTGAAAECGGGSDNISTSTCSTDSTGNDAAGTFFEKEQEEDIRRALRTLGFEFVRIQLAPAPSVAA